LSPRSLLEFEWSRSLKRCLARFAKALRILGMKNTRANFAVLYFLERQSREVERHLIRIEGMAGGTEHHDHLRNRIDDQFQLGFGTLAFFDIRRRAVPTRDLPGGIAHRLRVKEKPPVFTVVPANAGFDPDAF